MTSHFDVILYDQLEAPVLWTETNPDKSQSGLARVIPAEHVRAVLEVKSALTRRTLRDALEKLNTLLPVMAGNNAEGDIYPKYLPANAIASVVFFEIRVADAKDLQILNSIRDYDLPRLFYGPVVLRGEGINPNHTGIFKRLFVQRRGYRTCLAGEWLAKRSLYVRFQGLASRLQGRATYMARDRILRFRV